MNIGENILKMRKEKGITQEQLADVLCISAGAISKWETSASIPDIAMLPKIAGFFGVSIDKIFGFALTESDTPEEIIKKVKELTVEFDYDGMILKADDIQPIFKVDEAISILTDACIKFPNNYELKASLCQSKHLSASRYINEPENYKKALQEVLDELHAVIKVNTDKEINDKCYSIMGEIYLKFKEYDKAAETAKKYGVTNNLMVGYNNAMITSLIAQNKKDEAEKFIHNAIYASITQIYTCFMSYMSIMPDYETGKKMSLNMINGVKSFADDNPGPFDLYMFAGYQLLSFLCLGAGEYEESVKYFEATYNHAEKFKIFSETREVTYDFIKLADKDKFCYNMPYDYKKHLQLAFAGFDSTDKESHDYKNYQELKKREDFQKFLEKLI